MDWAALAQQWIKMKETVVPPAPPPPTINPIYSANDGSGEAPMDMDTKDDEVPPAPPAPTISGSGTRGSMILYLRDSIYTRIDRISFSLVQHCDLI